MDLTAILSSVVDSSAAKAIPAGARTTPADVAAMGWNLFAGDLHLPALVLKESALEHNLDAMARWCARNQVLLAPHGKTTMCPQIYDRQIAKGAWGITVATAAQALVCARFGVERIVVANQLVGRGNIGSVVRLMADDPRIEVYCLVDSVEGVEHLAGWMERLGAARPLRALLEWGQPGRRTGVRSVGQGEAVCRALLAHGRSLKIAGVEGFEGLSGDPAEATRFLDGVRALGDSLGSMAPDPLLLSIGGTAYLDLVAEAARRLAGRFQPLVRSGCYVTHDHGFYARMLAAAQARGAGRETAPALLPALELWSYVQSRPEPDRVLLTFGRRDCGYDLDLPRPLRALAPDGLTRDLGDAAISGLNDQHAYLTCPVGSKLEVGDLVACGISHPCTTFEKWAWIPVVDDRYDVIDLYRTFF